VDDSLRRRCHRSRRGRAECSDTYIGRGATACVFTLGAEGAFNAHRDGTRLLSPAYDITVVNTTVCGDAFDAGFITARTTRCRS
jgi:sugar/nucleoside kinase (ribokinase family)